MSKRGRPPVIKIGDRFGRLEVIAWSDFKPRGYEGGSLWYVRCDCGCEKIVAARNLSSGNTRSCGCLSRAGIRTGYRKTCRLQRALKQAMTEDAHASSH